MNTESLTRDNEAKSEKVKWSKRHPILFAALVTVSNAFSFVFFIGFESIVKLDIVPILVYTILMALVYAAFRPLAKYFERDKPPFLKRTAVIAGCIAVFAVFFAAMLIFAYCVLPPVSVAPETTYVTEPRRKNGQVDYRRFLEDRILGPEELRYDNNGYRMILAAFGKVCLNPDCRIEERDIYWSEICDQFRLEPDLKPTHRLATWEIGLDRRRTEQAWKRPWTGGEFPELAFWIAEQEANLELLSDALRRERFLIVPMSLNETWGDLFMFPVRDLFRKLAYTLHCRALLHIGNDEPEEAMNDIETLYRLATILRKQVFDMDDIWNGSTIQWYANNATFYLVRDGKLDVPGLRNLHEKRRSLLGDLSRRDFALLWRIDALERMQSIASGQFFLDDDTDRGIWEKRYLIANIRLGLWNRAFRQLNDFFDRLNARLAEPGYFELEELSRAVVFAPKNDLRDGEFSKFMRIAFFGLIWKGQIGLYPWIVAEMLGGGFFLDTRQSGFDCFFRLEATDRMTELIILLELFRREHAGRYPEHLDELVKGGYIDGVPSDPFSREARPIGYRRKGVGYVLSHEGKINGQEGHRLECDPVGWGRSVTEKSRTLRE